MVQLVEMAIDKFSPALYASLGVFLPLIAGELRHPRRVALHGQRDYNLAEATVFGLGSGIGWWMAIVALAAIRERMKYSNVPAPCAAWASRS
ncbi:MAG: Rnf-Nqr domain containing protein [Planctomycetota bacterium]